MNIKKAVILQLLYNKMVRKCTENRFCHLHPVGADSRRNLPSAVQIVIARLTLGTEMPVS